MHYKRDKYRVTCLHSTCPFVGLVINEKLSVQPRILKVEINWFNWICFLFFYKKSKVKQLDNI